MRCTAQLTRVVVACTSGSYSNIGTWKLSKALEAPFCGLMGSSEG
jgi:hypothetical protein